MTDIKNSNIKKRRDHKALSKHITLKLYNENKESEISKTYWNTYYCANELNWDTDKKRLVGHYCKNRHCITCNNIRMATNIKEYVPYLATWINISFVTLSTVNCYEGQIRSQVQEYMKIIELVKKRYARKRGKELKENGLDKSIIIREMEKPRNKLQMMVKIEVTFNDGSDMAGLPPYHPHLHLLVNDQLSREASNFILETWIEIARKRGLKCSYSGQDQREADVSSIVEMMKYFTKIFQSKTVEGKKVLYLNSKALDVILTELRRLRLYRSIGFGKDDRQSINKMFEFESELEHYNPENEEKVFSWVNDIFDWVERNTGELLVGNEIPDEYYNFIKGKSKTLSVQKKEIKNNKIDVKNIQENTKDGFI